MWLPTTNGSNGRRRFRGSRDHDLDRHRRGTDRCREALDKAEALCGERFDIVVNIQGDEPFVSEEQLSLISGCFDEPSTQIATLVKAFAPHEDIFNSNSPKVVLSADGHALYFSRSAIPFLRGVEPSQWQSSHTYYKHIGLYAYRSDVLRKITALPQGHSRAMRVARAVALAGERLSYSDGRHDD